MTEVVAVRLDGQEAAELRQIAERDGCTVSDLMRRGATMAIERHRNKMEITWVTEPSEVYGELVVSRRQALIEHAPESTLMALEMLRHIDSARFVGADRIYLGEDANAEPVMYRIVGWDAGRSALILRLVTR